jgi:hypothetical protein
MLSFTQNNLSFTHPLGDLSQLPRELIIAILTQLPSYEALDFIEVCRESVQLAIDAVKLIIADMPLPRPSGFARIYYAGFNDKKYISTYHNCVYQKHSARQFTYNNITLYGYNDTHKHNVHCIYHDEQIGDLAILSENQFALIYDWVADKVQPSLFKSVKIQIEGETTDATPNKTYISQHNPLIKLNLSKNALRNIIHTTEPTLIKPEAFNLVVIDNGLPANYYELAPEIDLYFNHVAHAPFNIQCDGAVVYTKIQVIMNGIQREISIIFDISIPKAPDDAAESKSRNQGIISFTPPRSHYFDRAIKEFNRILSRPYVPFKSTPVNLPLATGRYILFVNSNIAFNYQQDGCGFH